MNRNLAYATKIETDYVLRIISLIVEAKLVEWKFKEVQSRRGSRQIRDWIDAQELGDQAIRHLTNGWLGHPGWFDWSAALHLAEAYELEKKWEVEFSHDSPNYGQTMHLLHQLILPTSRLDAPQGCWNKLSLLSIDFEQNHPEYVIHACNL